MDERPVSPPLAIPPGRGALRRLALARVVSGAGSMAARIALVYVVYDRTGSSAWVSLVLIADLGITAGLGPISGWIGDHFDRKRVLVLSEIGAGLAYLAAAVTDAPPLLVAGTLAAAVLGAPFAPASSAAVPNLVAPGDLAWANSQLALAQNLALVIGPLVGGWLVAAAGIQLVFVVNAVSFLLSAVVIARMPADLQQSHGPASDAGHPGRDGLRLGYQVVARNPVVRTLVAALALAHFTFGIAMVADPALADEFGAGSFGYAVLYTGWGVTAVVGAWLAGRMVPNASVAEGVVAGLATMGLGCLAIAFLPEFWAVAVIGSLGGLGSGAVFPLAAGLLQAHTDDRVRARVFGASETVQKTLFAFGMLVGGPAVATLGGQGAYAATGTVIVLAAVLALRLRSAVRTPAVLVAAAAVD